MSRQLIELAKKYYRRTGKVMNIYKPDDRLSPHFTYDELIRSQTATRYGIDNTPSPIQIENLISLCKYVLEPIRIYYKAPVFVTSGFRCLELNRRIGSSDTSQHIEGQAADIVVSKTVPYEVWTWIITKSLVNFDQVILEFATKTGGGWVHVSYKNDSDNRRKCSVAKKVDGVTKYYHFTQSDIKNGRHNSII